MNSREAKDFRKMEKAYRAASDAAGKVAAVLEDQNHSEDELAEALGMFILLPSRCKGGRWMENFNEVLSERLAAYKEQKAAEKKREEVISSVCRAMAQAIKEICKANTVCEVCPWFEMCGTEPYSWKIPEEDT